MKVVRLVPPLLLLLCVPMVVPGAAATGQGPCLPALTLTDEGNGSLRLDWLAIDNATAYQVLVRTDTGDWFPISPQTPPSSTTYTYQGQANVTYHFAVVALQGGSNPIATFCTVSNATTAPPCPANLVATPSGDSVVLTWDGVPAADGYNVYGPSQDGPNEFLGHTQDTKMTVASFAEATYTVTAEANGHEAGPCPTVSLAQTPFFPTPLAMGAGLLGILGAGFVLLRRR